MFNITPKPSTRAAAPDLVTPLSSREQETLDLIARGFSCAEIARLQLISVHTTRTHVRSIYSKLDVHSRSEAIFEAITLGLIRTDQWAGLVRHQPSPAP